MDPGCIWTRRCVLLTSQWVCLERPQDPQALSKMIKTLLSGSACRPHAFLSSLQNGVDGIAPQPQAKASAAERVFEAVNLLVHTFGGSRSF